MNKYKKNSKYITGIIMLIFCIPIFLLMFFNFINTLKYDKKISATIIDKVIYKSSDFRIDRGNDNRTRSMVYSSYADYTVVYNVNGNDITTTITSSNTNLGNLDSLVNIKYKTNNIEDAIIDINMLFFVLIMLCLGALSVLGIILIIKNKPIKKETKKLDFHYLV